MDNTSVRPADDIEQVVEAYGNTLFRVAMGIVGNSADAEDAVQETFIKYLDQKNVFDFISYKKADQPLSIRGSWTDSFTIEK